MREAGTRRLVIENVFPEVTRLSVGDLLKECYRVPEFQRPYAWREPQIEQFWEDIYQAYRTREPLFLGIMVFQRQRGGDLEIIDGHQRLCTIFISLLAIRKLLLTEGRDISTRELDQYIWKFNIRDIRERARLVLTNPDDSQVLRSLLEGEEPERSENRLNKAHDFLLDKLRELQNESVDLLDFADSLLNCVLVVKIIVGEQGDPFSIFEVLNARGLELTCWDLVKNRLLGDASKVSRNEVDQTRRIINNIEDMSVGGSHVDPDFLSKFLRHLWLSKVSRVSKPRLYRAICDYLRQSRCSPSSFASDLRDELEDYIYLIEPEDDIPEARDLKDLVACGFEQGRPLLMATRRVGQTEDFIQALRMVSSLHVRYQVCGLNPNRLERFFSEAAIGFRRGEKNIEAITREARGIMPSNELFEDSLIKEDLSANLAKYLLRKVEERRRRPESLRERPIGEVDLEHIMPKKRSEEWPNYDPDLINKLGNLTLIGPTYNRRVRNRGFEAKRQEFRNSELLITSELANFTRWGREEIEERGRGLAREIADIFSF